MKSHNNQIHQSTIADAVREAVLAAPSRHSYEAAKRRFAELCDLHDKAVAEEKRTRVELYSNDRIGEKARDLIANRPTPAEKLAIDANKLAVEQVRVTSEACRLQGMEVQRLRASFTDDLLKGVSRVRHAIAASIDRALREVRAAADDDETLRRELVSTGADGAMVTPVCFPSVSSTCMADAGWREGVRALGFEI